MADTAAAAAASSKQKGSSAAAAPPVVPFKKRARRDKKKNKNKQKKGGLRRKPVATLNDGDASQQGDDDDDDAEELSTLLTDVVAEQRTRARSKGVAARSFRAAKRDEDSDDDDVPGPGADGYDPSVGGVVPKDKLALLDAQYTGATKAKSENENPHLLKYIDEKMGTGNKDGDAQGQKAKSEFDKLYELPSHMKAVREKGQGDEVTEDKALGGAVAFGTGIAEVELPIEYQLENIERTELAKSEFIKQQNSRRYTQHNDLDEMDGHGSGGNFGSNFRQHNRDFKKRKREEFRRFEGRAPGPGDANIVCHTCNKPGHKSTNCPQNSAGGAAAGPGRPRVQMASDDIVMRRFWTRMRNMRRM
eukprot:INCI771.1.p1 GENE.INCI771.1~~INCI771.1.p1  ORF type:complete len:361 (+),score=100.17 INCI771.1:170-1252(+)